MARAKISSIIYLTIISQICSKQCEANTIPQQTIQNNVVNTQNLNQNVDLANFNAQKQAVGQQHNLNLQQFANVPMQTFNVQPLTNPHHQGNSQQTNYQAVNQALNLQQVPQHYNVQQEVPLNNQQITSRANLQQATVIPVNSQQPSNVQTTPQAVIVQQPSPVQSLNLQQQGYPVNSQQPTQVQTKNIQQTSPQSISLQQGAGQPLKVQQPTQQSVLPAASLQNQGGLQKSSQTSAHTQQPSMIQPVINGYQQPVQQYDPIAITQIAQQLPLQQLPIQQIDLQQHIPCNNRGNYQVKSSIKSYQNPCQLSENTLARPMTLPLSTLSSNPSQTIIATIPAAMTIPSTATLTDQIYVLSPQNYLTSASYTPTALTDTFQSALSGHPIQVPVITVPNSAPSPSNSARSNCNQQFETENWTWSQKIPDIGMLNELQFPIASLLGQPTSSVQSALLSSVLSSIQGPATSPQYIISPSYPAQTILSPPSNSQGSKLSLKSLLPLLLNMIQEKYSNNGCQCCSCCNCECFNNKNILQENTDYIESHMATEMPTDIEEENVTSEMIQNDESTEIEDEPVIPRRSKEPNTKQNIIPNDSTEIEDAENSSYVEDDVEDEPELDNDSEEINKNI